MPRRRRELPDETEINITPMLDIVFIMLIFFIVTTSFVKETGIDPNRPEAVLAEPKPRGNILIAVSAANEIWMEKRQVELADVRLRVESALKENPESSAVIVADEKALTGVVIDLMDQVQLGGVTKIAVAAESEQ